MWRSRRSPAFSAVLSLFSSLALDLVPRESPLRIEFHSAWISWAVLLAFCLVKKSRWQAAPQHYELLEAGTSRSLHLTYRPSRHHVSVMAAVLVTMGLLSTSPVFQYSLPGLVIVASLASRHGLPSVSERCIPTPVSDCGLYKDPISPGEPNVTSESHFAEEKPRKLWNVLITCYTVLMSTYIVVLLYQKTEIDRSPTFIIAGGAGFIACGAYIYTVLSRPGTIIESTTESRSSSDSRFATSVLVQAFFLATLIAVFTPSEGTVQYFLLTSGVLQAFRWASIYHLATSGFALASATTQLAALGVAQVLLHDNLPVAAVMISAAVVISIITLPVSKQMPWRTLCLLMLLPPLGFTLSLWPQGLLDLQSPSLPQLPHDTNIMMHPIEQLYLEGHRKFENMLSRQSKTVDEAITEYRRRYERNPPKGFERWVELALGKGLVLIDEFDGMMRAFEPFHDLNSTTLKGLVNAATIVEDPGLTPVGIRNGVIHPDTSRGPAFFTNIITKWLDPYQSLLPNVTLLLNTNDEPRVVVPQNVLARTSGHRSSLAKELADDNMVVLDRLSLGRQHPWSAVTMSCPDDSPARQMLHSLDPGDLAFVSNIAETVNVCNHYDYSTLHGLLNSPDTMTLYQSFVPIFSQGKVTSFQDLLYPSPYYQKHRHEYDNVADVHWNKKQTSVYWAGSATGGFVTTGNWRDIHRQRMTMKCMPDTAPRIVSLLHQNTKEGPWESFSTESSPLQKLFNVKITGISQCEETACKEQKKAFHLDHLPREPMSASYRHKYVLDMDGNSFSGRFYRLLTSRSAVIKQTIVQEWHDDWLVPWYHYMPLSVQGNEIHEMMRFLATTERGENIGSAIAKASTEWAGKVLRDVDFELVLLRLLLEYGNLFEA